MIKSLQTQFLQNIITFNVFFVTIENRYRIYINLNKLSEFSWLKTLKDASKAV